jgi:hypothetical protein
MRNTKRINHGTQKEKNLAITSDEIKTGLMNLEEEMDNSSQFKNQTQEEDQNIINMCHRESLDKYREKKKANKDEKSFVQTHLL